MSAQAGPAEGDRRVSQCFATLGPLGGEIRPEPVHEPLSDTPGGDIRWPRKNSRDDNRADEPRLASTETAGGPLAVRSIEHRDSLRFPRPRLSPRHAACWRPCQDPPSLLPTGKDGRQRFEVGDCASGDFPLLARRTSPREMACCARWSTTGSAHSRKRANPGSSARRTGQEETPSTDRPPGRRGGHHRSGWRVGETSQGTAPSPG